LTDYGDPVGREQGFCRPAVILNGSLLDSRRMGLTVAVPLTSRRRGWPSHVEVAPGPSGLREKSWAMAEQIRAISTTRLRHRLGVVEPDEVGRITQVIFDLLDM
jgi:mRNA interferase MazF